MANKKLLTKISPVSETKALVVETIMNNTDKISKITDLSVVNANAFAMAKLLQKDLKETAILESQITPELSSGTYLDNAAKLVGNSVRLGSTGSSTSVYVIAVRGTQYLTGEHVFTSTQGIQFNVTEVVTIDDNGYGYVPVISLTSGLNTNVDAMTINSISPTPTGHISCTNEYMATGGRDVETDEEFKIRISTFNNFAANGTLSKILENLQLLDTRILFLINQGRNDSGQIELSIVTNNGITYLDDELRQLEANLSEFVNLSDLNIQGGNIGIRLINTDWYYVGGGTYGNFDFRVDIYSGYDEDVVRRSIQLALTKYLDFRFWTATKIEWDNLLQIVKGINGVKYVPDEYFNPSVDEIIPTGKLPRIMKFIMRDMDGAILYNNNSALLPIYYNV